jgi:signal transduction histidine kinase
MVRSPFLIFLILLSFFSCKKESTNRLISKQNNQYAYSLLIKGDDYFNSKKFDSAFFYYNKSKAILELESDSTYIPYCLNKIAETQQTYCDYNGSEETLTELLQYKIPMYIAPAYNQLGIISKEQKNYDDAIKYYTLALNSTKNKVDKQSPRNNIAAVYIQKKEYVIATSILESILKSGLLDADTFQIKKARVLDNLGYAYFRQNQIEDALIYLNKGLEVRNKINDTYGVIESYLHFAEFYQNQNLQKSNGYALKGYENATELKSINERLEALSILMSNNTKPGKNKYAVQFITLNDSITKVRNNAKNQFAKIKYDSKKERDENQKLKLENAENQLQYEKVKTQRLFSSIGLCIVIGSIFFIVRHFRNKNKKEKEKAVYDTETRISKQLHDELANDVFQVMSFAETQDLLNAEKKETIIGNLDKIYARTRDISRKNSEIDTGVHYATNLKQMLLDFGNNKIKVIIKDNNDINWDKVQKQSKIIAYRVLQELMVNMKKHSGCSIVVIGFENKDGIIQFTYTDNGVGISNPINVKNGLLNAENRINSINGTITFEKETEKGFRVWFSLPK